MNCYKKLGILLLFITSIVFTSPAQDHNAKIIWQRVLDANRAWLNPPEINVYFEQATHGRYYSKTKLWYKGPDFFLYQFDDGSKHLFYDNLYILSLFYLY